jgi:predicted AAA+ superfamily ATPase
MILTGPRQVGKTTLLKHMADERRKYVALDNPSDREMAKRDPELFLQRYSPPVIIDEVQYAPELFDYIKIHADTHKGCGDFWLTGSQTFHLMKNVTESMAGRVGVIRMLGLSNSEIDGTGFGVFEVNPQTLIKRLEAAKRLSLPEVYERIFKGSFPRLYENPDVSRKYFYESYLETYISRDVKDLTQVADEMAFLRFVGAAAARTATNVNYDTLANEVGISAPTAKQWLSVLVSGGLVALIPPFASNALKRVIKAPRMYFTDTGLCAYLTRMNSPEFMEAGAMDGAFFETWVVSEIYKSYINNGERPPLYFYRDQNKKEIDLIIHQNNKLYPIEIKKSAHPKNAHKHFSVLKPITQDPGDENRFSGAAHLKTEIGTGAVICLASNVTPVDRNNWCVPAWLI